MQSSSEGNPNPARGRIWVAAIVLGAAIVGATAILLAVNWPFTEEKIAESLGGRTGSNVRMGRFRATYLPSPGCVMDDVTFHRGPGVALAKAERITIQSTWAALATRSRRVRLLQSEGLHVRIQTPTPPPVRRQPPSQSTKRPETIIGELVANGAVLEIGNEPVRFQFEELTIKNAGTGERMGFQVKLRGSHAPGAIGVKGSFGPWKEKQTDLSGSFSIADLDLGRYPGIGGRLRSKGEVQGTLSSLQVRGESDTAEFRVNPSPNRMRLRTRYGLTVDGFTGDVVIERVEASFLETTLFAAGKITGIKGKKAVVSFDSRNARIEDLLRMFTSNPRGGLKGPIALRAHVELPPGPGKFLSKLRLDGRFGIDDARFTSEATQSRLNGMSARARSGKDRGEEEDDPFSATPVLSDLKGTVTLRNGLARLSDVSLSVPGAHATGAGHYDLISKKIDLRGKVALDASLSEASGGGWKSVILKPLNFLYKKEHAGAVVPVFMTGKYPRPKLQVSLTRRK